MRILLTGSSGFIGRNILESWKGKYNILAPSHHELDLTDDVAVKECLKKTRPDVVIHAANTNDFAHPELKSTVIESNLRMFFNMINCEEYYGKLLYFGSGAEFDQRHYIPDMTEDYFGKYVPADSYGFSKYIMARVAEYSDHVYNLRLFGVFGKYEEWKRRFISNLIYLNMTGQTMRMGVNRYFDYLYVEDLLRILEWFLFHEPKYHSYNVCSGEKIDLHSLGDKICVLLGQDPSILAKQSGWGPIYTGDNTRLRTEIGTAFLLTQMDQAIADLINYYKRSGSSLW